MGSQDWSFCMINEKEWYFGEALSGLAHGDGIYIYENEVLIYAEWEKGTTKSVYNSIDDIKSNEFIDGNRIPLIKLGPNSIDNISVSFYDVKDYDQTQDIKEELLYNVSLYPLGTYYIKRYCFTFHPYLKLIIKNAYVLSLFSEKAYSLSFASLNYTYSTDYIEFSIITEQLQVVNLENIFLNLQPSNKLLIKSCQDLIDSLTALHVKNIALTNISLSSIAAKNDWSLVFYDFSRAMFLRSNDDMVDTIFTSSKEFKPPEACQNLQHNPFAADVFALGLVILSLFVGKNLGEADFAVINQEISLINNVVQQLYCN